MKKQTRRIVALLVTILLLFSCFSIVSFAAESDFEWTDKDGKAVITKYVGTSKDVTVPETIGGLTVTEIGSQAFAFVGIEKIKLPDTIEKIGEGAFWQNYFTSFEIPPKVTEIAANTFRGCHLLKDINLHNGIKSIGDFAFQDCNALTKIVIPKSVKTLGDAVFYSCRGLKSVVIPESITEIPLYTFFCCLELTDVNWHDGITSIGEAAFNQCSSLKKIVINNPDCTIYDKETTLPKAVVIYGAKASTAENYAKKYGLQFASIDISMIGDVDGNSNITAADARLALRISAKLLIPTEAQKTAADIDKSGNVNAADARKILRIAAQLD